VEKMKNKLRCSCGNIATYTFADTLPVCKSCKYLIEHDIDDPVANEIKESVVLIRRAQSKMNIFDLV
jgi:hypothetical protein